MAATAGVPEAADGEVLFAFGVIADIQYADRCACAQAARC